MLLTNMQNEQAHVAAAIASAKGSDLAAGEPEVIVVDGGSTDSTRAEATKAKPARILCATGGRGAQLNAGAAAATRPWLLFMHADCQLPDGYFEPLAEAFKPQATAWWHRVLRIQATPQWGTFETIDTGHKEMARVQWGIRMRTRFLSQPYGDQGFVCRNRTFQQVQALRSPDLCLMWRKPYLPVPCFQALAQSQIHNKYAVTSHHPTSAGQLLSRMAFLGRLALGAEHAAQIWRASHCFVRHAHIAAKMAAPWHRSNHLVEPSCVAGICVWGASGRSASTVYTLTAPLCW